jgi:hypothetical protein
MENLWDSMLEEIHYASFKYPTGNSDAHIIQLDRSEYNAPNLVKIFSDQHDYENFSFWTS